MKKYLSQLTLDATHQALVNDHIAGLKQHLDTMQQAPVDRTDQQLFSYKVPELGDNGACSIHDELAAEPYDLTTVLGQANASNRQRLNQMHDIVAYITRHSTVEWYGIYQTFSAADGSRKLVKLAYHGLASRAEYPLTAEFAENSNNVSVGLSGQGKVINDVAAYCAAGGAYYQCDPKVKAEICLPIFSSDEQDSDILGIIDAEAFHTDFFDQKELALMVASCIVIGSMWTNQQNK